MPRKILTLLGARPDHPKAVNDTDAMAEIDRSMNWYESAARRNTGLHYTVSLLLLVAGALVTIVSQGGIDEVTIFGLTPATILAALGFTIVVAEGLSKLFKFEQRMLLFRQTREILRIEMIRYRGQIGEYADLKTQEDAEKQFIARATEILMAEHRSWLQLSASQPNQRNAPQSRASSAQNPASG